MSAQTVKLHLLRLILIAIGRLVSARRPRALLGGVWCSGAPACVPLSHSLRAAERALLTPPHVASPGCCGGETAVLPAQPQPVCLTGRAAYQLCV